MSTYRVTQRSMFSNFVNNMNSSLSELMNSNEQASSQKKINRPSDDPVGAARVLSYRFDINSLKQYQVNVDTGKGWLTQADSTLTSVNTVLTRVRELAEQAATGTMSKDNRKQAGFEVRQLFEQLITLSNTEFEDQHIFAGHKTDQAAFSSVLGVTANVSDASTSFQVTGNSASTVLVQFLNSGAVGGIANLGYRYSRDGGDTWATGTLAAGQTSLDLNGVQVQMQRGGQVHATNIANPTSVAPNGAANGTWLWVRPTAFYHGDDQDRIAVDRFGQSTIAGSASGFFQEDVYVRIDNSAATPLSSTINYSYSLDKGLSWKTGNTATGASATAASLLIPGGYLSLATSNAAATLNPNDQFIVRPNRAKINFEISDGERLTVNNIGKDVFGGIYKLTPCASGATIALNGSPENMFETVGKLVGFIETNNQSGVQQALENLQIASQHILTVAADVGARENRLEVQDSVLSNLVLNTSERLSTIEDVDVAELMTKLAQQQLIYESVLKSSSTIMRMSLINYI